MSDSLNRNLFGGQFHWGVSTAAFQTEGAWNADGKGESIWDTFTHKKGKVKGNQNADTACDFYHRYKQDIDLLKEMGIPNFRFSLSWTRIMPRGAGEVNQAGIDFYNNVINYCIEQGVTPWVTLYHWDLPQALEAQGGWTNRNIINWFSDYTAICAKAYGDRVKHWMVMNEPAVFTGAGYFLGIHAPGRRGLRNFLPAVHHAVLSIAAGARKLREILPDADIGTTFSCSHIEPYRDRLSDKQAAIRADALINRLFIEPTLDLGYPVKDLPVLKKLTDYIQPGDEHLMAFDFDFIGLQNYTRELVKYSFFTPYISASLVKAKDRKVPTTEMGWEVYPHAMYEVLKKFNAYSQIKQIYITENGAAFKDVLANERVNDVERTKYLQDNITQVLKARQEGCRVNGYFVWTLTDNFEWAEGYHPRFGLIHVNFETLKRTIKDSGYWYQEFLK
ncbi:GH1 family beta-glucosidase [Mucilaginibacter sp.]